MKKGQIAIWVILALVLAGGILLFFYLENKPVGTTGEGFSPEQFIEKCTSDAVNEVVDKIMPQGGILDPKVYKLFNDTKVTYYCKLEGYYKTCVNIHPMIISEVSNEIRNYIAPRIDACFESLRENVEKKGGTITMDPAPTNFSVSLVPNLILVNILKKVDITEKETTRSFEKFGVEIASPLRHLVEVALTIANSERNYCYFEYVGYMGQDRDVDIRKFVMSDATKIYTIEDRKSGKIMNIATRSCSIPAGF